MQAQAPEPAAIVAHALARISNLPTLPEVTLRVLRLTSDPEVSLAELCRVVSHAPALCLTMLRVANSAFYGMPGRVTSVERAAMLLGVAGIRNLTVAAGMVRVFTGEAISPRCGPVALWHHSVAVAAAAQRLAARAGRSDADQAFLAGLIHDVGFMVEMHTDLPRFRRVVLRLESDPALDVCAVEREEFGVTHEAFGAALCRAWQIPAVLADAVGSHHHPLPADPGVAVLVALGDGMVSLADPAFPLDCGARADIETLLAAAGLTRAAFDSVAGSLPADASRLFA